MKAETTPLDHSGDLDEQDDPVRVARGFAFGLGLGALLWILAAALIVWLV